MSGEFFKWDQNKYGLSISKMDLEHHDIIDTMNRLFEAQKLRSAKREIQQIFDDLITITEAHFTDEEVFFSTLGDYSDRVMTHKGLHRSLMNKLRFHYDEFMKTSNLSSEFFNFLKMWLQAHICGIDTQYAKHVPFRDS